VLSTEARLQFLGAAASFGHLFSQDTIECVKYLQGGLSSYAMQDNQSRSGLSGLSYFTIQIQSWILKTQFKSNHDSKFE